MFPNFRPDIKPQATPSADLVRLDDYDHAHLNTDVFTTRRRHLNADVYTTRGQGGYREGRVEQEVQEDQPWPKIIIHIDITTGRVKLTFTSTFISIQESVKS